ncbi:Protein HIR2 [Cucumispora dikerogammari]|nr:Protein HIR2 [Cucumispora dikerogammari]
MKLTTLPVFHNSPLHRLPIFTFVFYKPQSSCVTYLITCSHNGIKIYCVNITSIFDSKYINTNNNERNNVSVKPLTQPSSSADKVTDNVVDLSPSVEGNSSLIDSPANLEEPRSLCSSPDNTANKPGESGYTDASINNTFISLLHRPQIINLQGNILCSHVYNDTLYFAGDAGTVYIIKYNYQPPSTDSVQTEYNISRFSIHHSQKLSSFDLMCLTTYNNYLITGGVEGILYIINPTSFITHSNINITELLNKLGIKKANELVDENTIYGINVFNNQLLVFTVNRILIFDKELKLVTTKDEFFKGFNSELHFSKSAIISYTPNDIINNNTSNDNEYLLVPLCFNNNRHVVEVLDKNYEKVYTLFGHINTIECVAVSNELIFIKTDIDNDLDIDTDPVMDKVRNNVNNIDSEEVDSSLHDVYDTSFMDNNEIHQPQRSSQSPHICSNESALGFPDTGGDFHPTNLLGDTLAGQLVSVTGDISVEPGDKTADSRSTVTNTGSAAATIIKNGKNINSPQLLIATSSQDKTLCIWSTSADKPLLILKNFTTLPILHMVFIKNTLICSSYDGYLKRLVFDEYCDPNYSEEVASQASSDKRIETKQAETNINNYNNWGKWKNLFLKGNKRTLSSEVCNYQSQQTHSQQPHPQSQQSTGSQQSQLQNTNSENDSDSSVQTGIQAQINEEVLNDEIKARVLSGEENAMAKNDTGNTTLRTDSVEYKCGSDTKADVVHSVDKGNENKGDKQNISRQNNPPLKQAAEKHENKQEEPILKKPLFTIISPVPPDSYSGGPPSAPALQPALSSTYPTATHFKSKKNTYFAIFKNSTPVIVPHEVVPNVSSNCTIFDINSTETSVAFEDFNITLSSVTSNTMEATTNTRQHNSASRKTTTKKTVGRKHMADKTVDRNHLETENIVKEPDYKPPTKNGSSSSNKNKLLSATAATKSGTNNNYNTLIISYQTHYLYTLPLTAPVSLLCFNTEYLIIYVNTTLLLHVYSICEGKLLYPLMLFTKIFTLDIFNHELLILLYGAIHIMCLKTGKIINIISIHPGTLICTQYDMVYYIIIMYKELGKFYYNKKRGVWCSMGEAFISNSNNNNSNTNEINILNDEMYFDPTDLLLYSDVYNTNSNNNNNSLRLGTTLQILEYEFIKGMDLLKSYASTYEKKKKKHKINKYRIKHAFNNLIRVLRHYTVLLSNKDEDLAKSKLVGFVIDIVKSCGYRGYKLEEEGPFINWSGEGSTISRDIRIVPSDISIPDIKKVIIKICEILSNKNMDMLADEVFSIMENY